MNDPQRPLDHGTPRRAAPLQPDKPGSGHRRESPGEQPAGPSTDADRRDAGDRAREQENAAVDNTREGYR